MAFKSAFCFIDKIHLNLYIIYINYYENRVFFVDFYNVILYNVSYITRYSKNVSYCVRQLKNRGFYASKHHIYLFRAACFSGIIFNQEDNRKNRRGFYKIADSLFLRSWLFPSNAIRLLHLRYKRRIL